MKEKVIEVDLIEQNDLFEKYNKNKVSKDLINYLVQSTPTFTKNKVIKIVINNKLVEYDNCVELIKKGLKEEYDKSLKKHNHTNLAQFFYLIIGIIALFISTLIKLKVLREVILIGGWVLIWSMIELEMFNDTEDKKRRIILKRLLNSEIIHKK